MPSVSRQTKGNNKLLSNGSSVNGDVNGHEASHHEDNFQHLPKPQQDVLLLHGPRQKYSLDTNGQIPELRSEREILVQVWRRMDRSSKFIAEYPRLLQLG